MFQGKKEGEFPGLSPGVNPYQALGVMPGATLEEIKRHYYQKARELHPDRHHHLPQDERQARAREMAVLTESYKWFLSNPKFAKPQAKAFYSIREFLLNDPVAKVMIQALAHSPAPLEPQRGDDTVELEIGGGVDSPGQLVWNFVAGKGLPGKNGAVSGDHWIVQSADASTKGERK